MGDHLMNAGVRVYQGEDDYKALTSDLIDRFRRADFPEVIRILDRLFGPSYSLRSIFHDDQRKILDMIMRSTLADAEALYRQIYETHAPMMRFVSDLRVPLPRVFSMAAEFALNSSLRSALSDPENLDFGRIESLLEEAEIDKIHLDEATLGFALRRTIKQLSDQFLDNPDDIDLLKKLEAAAGVARNLPFEVNVWRSQDNYYLILQQTFPEWVEKAQQGDAAAQQWVEHFVRLGGNLAVKVDPPPIPGMRRVS